MYARSTFPRAAADCIFFASPRATAGCIFCGIWPSWRECNDRGKTDAPYFCDCRPFNNRHRSGLYVLISIRHDFSELSGGAKWRVTRGERESAEKVLQMLVYVVRISQKIFEVLHTPQTRNILTLVSLEKSWHWEYFFRTPRVWRPVPSSPSWTYLPRSLHSSLPSGDFLSDNWVRRHCPQVQFQLFYLHNVAVAYENMKLLGWNVWKPA